MTSKGEDGQCNTLVSVSQSPVDGRGHQVELGNGRQHHREAGSGQNGSMPG